jgi:NTP pyrophosphatase (non-canonical NTP hydrolase)
MLVNECSKEIKQKVSEAALYEQLAEECVELAHAALKLARIKRGENPTPVSAEEAMDAVMEEYTDLRLVAYVLEIGWDIEVFEQKLLRWHKRLGEVNGDA